MKLRLAAVLLLACAGTAVADPVNFADDAKLLYRIAACGAMSDWMPAVAPELQQTVDHHCKLVLERIAEFRHVYFEKGRSWFDKIEPQTLPTTVVYPFGGGDLLSALVAFPNATDITTISLEQAGDPRRLATLAPTSVEQSLAALRAEIGGLISVGSNTSENLSNQQRNDLPGQVSSFLLGLVAGGYEPVSMRYFTLTDTGDIHYLDQGEIDALDGEHGKSLKGDWKSPSFSPAFANVEIQYRKIGETQLRVHRHIAWNLSNKYMKEHPQLLAFLEKKGKVAILVKGASYLLWRGDFSTTRNYILGHLAWMLSDSTGVPPVYARKANMVQVTYGLYDGAFLEGAQGSKTDEQFVDLWKNQPRRYLPFRFGYVDMNKQAHLLVTRPK